MKEYQSRGAQPIVIFTQHAFQLTSLVPDDIDVPVLVDPASTVSATYGVAYQTEFREGPWSHRHAMFVIDPKGVLRHAGDHPETSSLEILDELKREHSIIEALGKSDARFAKAVKTALSPGGTETKSAVNIFIQALDDDRDDVRAGAAAALFWTALRAEHATPTLAQSLLDKDPRVRRYAALALGRMRAKETTAALIPILADKEIGVASSALLAIQRIGEDSVPHLINALKHAKPPVQSQAAETLVYFPEKANVILPALIDSLQDIHPDVRTAATESINGLAMDPAKKVLAIPALVSALTDDNEMVREAASMTLSNLGAYAKSGVPGLVRLLSHETPDVRARACSVLAFIGPGVKPAIPTLIAALDDKVATVRMHAAMSLGTIGNDAKAATPALLARINDSDRYARDEIIRALITIDPAKSKPALPILIATIKNTSNEDRKRNAISMVGTIGPDAREAVPVLLESANAEEFALQTVMALGRIRADAKRAVPAIANHATSKSKDVRSQVAVALAKFGEQAREAIPALLKLAKDENSGVRKAAINAIKEIDPASVEKIND